MNRFSTQRRRTDFAGRLQWERLALGLALAALGIAIVVLARAPALTLAWLGAISLVTAGLAQRAAPDETPAWLDTFPSLALMGAAVACIWWNPAYAILPRLIAAIVLGRALFALVRAASPAERCAAIFSASAAVLFGTVLLAWPLLAPFTFVFLFACWLVFAGACDVAHALHVRFRKATIAAGASPSGESRPKS